MTERGLKTSTFFIQRLQTFFFIFVTFFTFSNVFFIFFWNVFFTSMIISACTRCIGAGAIELAGARAHPYF